MSTEEKREAFLRELEFKSKSLRQLISVIGHEATNLSRETDSLFWLFNYGYKEAFEENFNRHIVKSVLLQVERLNMAADRLRKESESNLVML